jgi:heterodisulfide reductase subunit C
LCAAEKGLELQRGLIKKRNHAWCCVSCVACQAVLLHLVQLAELQQLTRVGGTALFGVWL